MTADDPADEGGMNLAEHTTQVAFYADVDHKETWKREARRHGYSSMSKYLYDLIMEARSYRGQGFLAHHDSADRIEELEAQVAALEEQLERERQKQSGRREIDDPAFIQQFLTGQYQSLPELLQQIVESGALDDLLRKRVEDQLYHLAAQDAVDYEPGFGWRLTDNVTED